MKPVNEWEGEPNRKHWVDEATGLDCLILRGPVRSLCGYVGVPDDHPWHGMDYNCPAIENLDVHGGITYADACSGRICHGTEHGDKPAHEHVWWFGFDCAHAGDLVPNLGKITDDEVYRNIAYVEAHCAKLATQLKEAT